MDALDNNAAAPGIGGAAKGQGDAAKIPTEGDPRWARVMARDGTADGDFFYSVRTTGVYCRPSCGARTPNPVNVRFHALAADAEAAGFRPCRRCRPDLPPLSERQAAMVARACRRLEDAEEPMTLADLSSGSGLSPFHFHRVFKAVAGVTPKDYAAAHRAKRVQNELPGSATVTEAIYGAGFSSNSRFYEKAAGFLGMAPADYRSGGVNAEIRFAIGECSLGSILVAKSLKGVCAIMMGDDPEDLLRDLQDRFPRARLIGGDADFETLVSRVVGFVETPRIGLDLPLDVRGTAFQRRVWRALQEIPVGRTASYAEVAAAIGAPKAVRAVAMACAANAIAVAIPCHRVVRTDGTLSGYRWGVERKRALLMRETQD